VNKLTRILNRLPPHATFETITFGCRVNAAESHQFSQLLIDNGLYPCCNNPNLFIINTCAITQKGEYESTAKIRHLLDLHPQSLIIATGCASLKIKHPRLFVLSNTEKEALLDALNSSYSPEITDKYTHSHRFLLKIQSGCTANCSYCVVPTRRSYLKSLPIDKAIITVNKAVENGYKEVIITGVNLAQYTPGLSNLLEALLTQTQIPLISFGSLPLLCIDDKFLFLIKNFKLKIKNFLHIPIQSGSDRILKLMSRPYTQKDILFKIKNLKLKIKHLKLGTDIIIGFPSETEDDLQETLNLCKSLSFTKIHTFRFSPRPGTPAWDLNQKFPVKPSDINSRSRLLRKLVS
jgi:threonylcarbamoyladenosine tRNA methylthiotransferase MtaB